ncbi:MAG: ABC transporter permease [candidate division WOR-3 bacterium]
MKLKDLISTSFEMLRTHRLRSFLTILGIVIGVMTIIAILSLIQGLNITVERQIQSLGSNTIFVQKYSWGTGRMDIEEIAKRKDLTLEDAWAIAKLPYIDKVAPHKYYNIGTLTYQGKVVKQIEIIGSTSDLQYTANYSVEVGRFINEEDYYHKQQVCCIGGYIVDNLFYNEDPIGKHLTIGGKRFIVIGTLARKGSFLGQPQDNIIIIPLSTFEKIFPKPTGYQAVFQGLSIQVLPKKTQHLEKVIDQIRELLRRRRGLSYNDPDDFGINTQETLREIYQNITRVAFIVMIGVATISLLVGGIGIMNIMLVAVVERTKEIGIRKAIGASTRSILYQFLIEAVILSTIGGILGIILGIGIAKLVSAATPLPAATPIWTVILGISFSAAVGIFFGIYPANRAAQLDPIQALRYE